MSFETKVYLESLQVLSEIDQHEEFMRETLETPSASPMTSRKISFTPLIETMDTFDGFYRNNQETVFRIYTSDRSLDDDYCTSFQNLPEFRAYQCIRNLRKRRRSFFVILLSLCSIFVGPKVLTHLTDNNMHVESIRANTESTLVESTLSTVELKHDPHSSHVSLPEVENANSVSFLGNETVPHNATT